MYRLKTLAPLALSALFLSAASLLSQSPMLSPHVPQSVADGTATQVGAESTSKHLQLAISLPLRNEDQLDSFLKDIYNPASPNYHHYLTSDEFITRFAPTQADYDKVVAWAQSKGLTVTNTVSNRRLVDVDGTVDVITRAFHANLKLYLDPKDPTGQRTFRAPDREPTLDLAIPILAVSGLSTEHPKHPHYKKGSALVQNLGLTQSDNVIAHISGSGPGNTYLPSDMRAAYYGGGPLTGAGQTVAIFSYDGYIVSDINVYYSHTGMSSSVPVKNVLVNGYNGACFGFTSSGQEDPSTCDDGEQILDIVNVIGMAPGLSQVLFYEGNSSTDVLNKMATDNTAKVISSSWGGGDFGTASDPIFKQFQAQGQTYLNATGDSGQFNSSTYAPPSVDPNITQVGGTDLTTTGAGGPWASETAWPESGGGYQTGTAIPSYQQLSGVINSSNKGSTTLRNAPDVAAEANYDNTTVINGTFESGYGGTSYATPRWAGLIALANQQAVAAGKSTLGFINPALYNIGVSSTYTSNYHDITSGNNKPSAGSGSGFNAVTGYDLVTGWGSPVGPTIINTLTGTGGGTQTPDYSLSASPSSLSVATGSSGTSTITVNKLNGFASSVALTASGLPTGVTAAFSPATATTSSTLTFTVASTATAATSTITVTGTSGSLSHTTTISLTVTKTATADYSLSASPTSLSVATGAAGTSTITVNKLNGFASSVALSASGLTTGVTAAFSPASTTTTSTLTLTVASTATAGTYPITITGASGSLSHTTSVSLTVTAASAPQQLLGNTGFENGTTTTPWTLSSGVICSTSTCSGQTPHSGSWFAWLDGYGSAHTDTAAQTVTLPAGRTSALLSFYLHIDTKETTTTTAYDTLKVQVLNSSGTVLATLATFSNLNKASGYTIHSYSLASYIGQTITLKFTGAEDSSLATSFVLDDVTLTVQ